MDLLPSNIIFDIFSRVPAKYLARSRCVSKVWCNYINDDYLVILHNERAVEEPTPILYHPHLCREKITRSLCFHVIKSKQAGASHSYVLDAKEGPYLEFLRMKTLSETSKVRIEVRGSCHGLICLSQEEREFDSHLITLFVVIHLLKKECYELPPFPLRFDKHMRRESCGLGFAAFTNTFKMVCVILKKYTPPNKPDMVRKNLCTLVHLIGTNSWREIPQVPCYPVKGKAIFANVCLNWLASHSDINTFGGREVIWFDVNKEEFGMIDPPERMCDIWRNYKCSLDELVDLNGEVGYVCARTMEVWVLKQKEWVPHCEFGKQIVPCGCIEVLGCWNKDGDMLIINRANGRYMFFIYNLKSGVLHKTNIGGPNDGLSPNFIMYPNTLSSIHGINNTNPFSMKKAIQKKGSCQHALSYYVPWN